MKINLEGKSPQYFSILGRCIEKYKESAPEKLKLFLKYANSDTGVVWDKLGILHILAPAAKDVLFVIEPASFAAFIVVNGVDNSADRELIRETFGQKTVITEIYMQKAEGVVDKVHELLWIRRRTWCSSLEKLKFVNLAEELVYLQELGALTGEGYTFDEMPALTEGEKKKCLTNQKNG